MGKLPRTSKLISGEFLRYQEQVRTNLRQVRHTRGWTQARLASELGVSQAAVHYVEAERGETLVPLAFLFAAAKALGVGVDALLRPAPRHGRRRTA